MVVWVYWKHINDHINNINNKIIINKKLEFACVMVCASLRHIIQSFYFSMMMMNNDLFNTTIIMYATMLFWWPWMHRLINIIYTNDDCIVPAIDCYKKNYIWISDHIWFIDDDDDHDIIISLIHRKDWIEKNHHIVMKWPSIRTIWTTIKKKKKK